MTDFAILLLVSSGLSFASSEGLLDRNMLRQRAIEEQTTGWEQRVRDDVMRNYRSDIPSLSEPIKIFYTLTKIIEVDEKSEQISLSAYLDITWTDKRLQWNMIRDNSSLFGYKIVNFQLNQIWFPNVVHYNDVGQRRVLLQKDENAFATGDAKVFWAGNIVLTFPCEMDITYFPMDTQICNLKFIIDPIGNPMQLKGQLNWEPLNHVFKIKYYPDSAWTINRTKDIVVSGSGRSPTIPNFRHKLRRKYQYYIYRILAPVTILSVLVIFVFFIPPDAGEKISLGVTLLLTFSVFQMIIDEDLPVSSDSTPLLTRAMILLQVCSAMSIVASVLVLHIHHITSEGGKKIPKVMRWIFFCVLARMTFHTKAVRQVTENGNLSKKEVLEPEEENGNVIKNLRSSQYFESTFTENQENEKLISELKSLRADFNEKFCQDVGGEWKVFALILDRVLMYICTITMIAIYVALFLQLQQRV